MGLSAGVQTQRARGAWPRAQAWGFGALGIYLCVGEERALQLSSMHGDVGRASILSVV